MGKTCLKGTSLAGAGGFEPPIAGPKPAALPLGYAPALVEVGGFEPPSENILASASTSLARVFFLGPRAPTGRIAWAQAPQVLAPGSGAGAQGASLLPSRPAIPRRRGDRGRPTPSSGRKRERKRSRHLFCRPVVLGANGSSACYLGLDVPVESGHPHSYIIPPSSLRSLPTGYHRAWRTFGKNCALGWRKRGKSSPRNSCGWIASSTTALIRGL